MSLDSGNSGTQQIQQFQNLISIGLRQVLPIRDRWVYLRTADQIRGWIQVVLDSCVAVNYLLLADGGS